MAVVRIWVYVMTRPTKKVHCAGRHFVLASGRLTTRLRCRRPPRESVAPSACLRPWSRAGASSSYAPLPDPGGGSSAP
eukprot:scaffold46109_cov45-Prasinocladus_malaysianus.AAC.1